jgi:hypothetical protein
VSRWKLPPEHTPKLWSSHKVRQKKRKRYFSRRPVIAPGDICHSKREKGYYLLGKQTVDGSYLRRSWCGKDQFRIISACDMNRREAEVYRQYEESWREDDPQGND